MLLTYRVALPLDKETPIDRVHELYETLGGYGFVPSIIDAVMVEKMPVIIECNNISGFVQRMNGFIEAMSFFGISPPMENENFSITELAE